MSPNQNTSSVLDAQRLLSERLRQLQLEHQARLLRELDLAESRAVGVIDGLVAEVIAAASLVTELWEALMFKKGILFPDGTGEGEEYKGLKTRLDALTEQKDELADVRRALGFLREAAEIAGPSTPAPKDLNSALALTTTLAALAGKIHTLLAPADA